MKAVVMAGGEGTRLRPLTSNQPKPMLPIVGQPMMQHVLRLVSSHGCTDVVATVQFLASIVRNWFGDGSDLGLSLSYAIEEEPLGTAGSVKNAEPLLDDRTLVLSGDALTDVDLSGLLRFHESHGAAMTVTLKRVEDPLEFGIALLDEGGRVQRFLEKPGWGEVFSDTINTGIYVIEREILDYVPEGEEFDFSRDLFPLLLDKGVPLYGYVTDGYWTDVGTIEAYMSAHRDVLDGRVHVEMEGFEVRPGVWLGEGAELDPDARIEGPAFVGEHARVEPGAEVLEYGVLGRSVTVKSGATIQRSVVHDNVYVGPSASLRGCVVGKNSDVKFGARLQEGVVVADQCHIREGAVLNPQVKVYPFKSVDPGAIVSKSIVWQSGGTRALFGERGVGGLFNVDVTPESALRLALAFATVAGKGSTLVSCRDATRAARVLKRAMAAGINAGGVDCDDLEVVPTPVARFYARSGRAMGGFAVRTAAADPSAVQIELFGERGTDIDLAVQRQLDRSYFRDDLRRAFHNDIGKLNFPARGLDYYVSGLLATTDAPAVREREPKVVVDYAFGGTALTAPKVLGHLRADVLAVNAVLDEERVVLSSERSERHLQSLAKIVGSSGAEIGALLDSPGERLHLVDGAGRALDERTALVVYAWLIARTTPSPTVALPVSTSRVAQRIVEEGGGRIVWTRISPAALMATAEEEGATFAGSDDGGYAFPEFLAAYDAVSSLAKLLELLAHARMSLREVVDLLPPIHVVRRDVPMPWEAKGTVMRRVLEYAEGGRSVTLDGVKIYRGDDWGLIAPHPQEPLVRVWAEGDSTDGAEALAEEFVSLVQEMKG